MMCFLFASVVGYIVWAVYAIIGLNEVSDETLVTENCGSLLWRYNLTMIILTFIQMVSSKPKDNEESTIAQLSGLLCSYFLGVGLATWGTYEIFERPCNNSITHYTLYTTGYIMVVTQWLFVGTITVLGFLTSLYCCLSSHNKKPPLPEPSNSISYTYGGV